LDKSARRSGTISKTQYGEAALRAALAKIGVKRRSGLKRCRCEERRLFRAFAQWQWIVV